MEISPQEEIVLLESAREAILAHLEQRTPRVPEAAGSLVHPIGAFVTLHLNDSLRGCIGRITASTPLLETVMHVAVESAFHDPRFPPLTLNELKNCDIEISVLSPLTLVEDTQAIVPGTHGVYIRRGVRSGLLLPQVATEQNWDRDTFLCHACYKAGLSAESWKDSQTEIYSFTAHIFGEKARC